MILQLTVGLYAPANRADVHGCSGSMLIQAIRSHIHFSQLSAWLSRSKGSIPSHVIYRSVLKPYQSDVTNKLNTVIILDTFHLYEKTSFSGGKQNGTGLSARNFLEKMEYI